MRFCFSLYFIPGGKKKYCEMNVVGIPRLEAIRSIFINVILICNCLYHPVRIKNVLNFSFLFLSIFTNFLYF